MLKTATGKAHDLESALLSAMQGFNGDTGTKEFIDSHFLYDSTTDMYVVIIMYMQYESVPDLPPQEKKGDNMPWYIGTRPVTEEDTV